MLQSGEARRLGFSARMLTGCLLRCLSMAMLAVAGVSAQETASLPVAETVEQVVARSEERFRRTFLEHGVAGLVFAASIDGRVVVAEGYGYADVEHRVPMWPHTKMRIGSVSKAITSLALGRLYEQGRLDLEAPIQRYVPDFPEKEHPITVAQVAGHLAGIRHYRGQEFLSSEHYDSVGEALAVFAGDPLLFEPGARYSYSSYGWNLLSAVVEGASGEPFLAYLQRHVFEPLSLRDTVADENAELIDHRTAFYLRQPDSVLRNAPYVDNSIKWAGGGLLSTGLDLLRLGNALLAGELLEAETLDLMWTSLETNDGEPTGYGLGWQIYGPQPSADRPQASADDEPLPEGVDRARIARHRIIGHGGGSIGGLTSFLILPDAGVVATAISNTSGPRNLGRDLFVLTAAMAVELAETRTAAAPATVSGRH